MMANRSDMILDRVDAADTPVGVISRENALRPGVGFRVVHVLIVDESRQLALQEISPSHRRHPGWWGSSVAGYVRAGEPYEQAAQRKLAEEVDLVGHPIEFLGRTRMEDQGATKFIGIFLVETPRELLKPNPKDFKSIEFAPLHQLQEELSSKARRFTPTFEQVIRFSAPFLAAKVR